MFWDRARNRSQFRASGESQSERSAERGRGANRLGTQGKDAEWARARIVAWVERSRFRGGGEVSWVRRAMMGGATAEALRPGRVAATTG